MGNQQMELAGGFIPVTSAYTTVQVGTPETVPANAALVVIKVYASGGSGHSDNSGGNVGGGGGGARFITLAIPVAGGNTFTVNLAAGGLGVASPNDGNPGGNATVTGTPAGGVLSITCLGGGPGTGSAGGAGGTAAGTGSASTGTATTGNPGTFASPGLGGAGLDGFGAGSNGKNNGISSSNGAIGHIEFDYS